MGQIMSTYGPLLLQAMGQTLLLALCGLFFGCILGIVFGLASVVDNKVSKTIAAIYVNLIRGVPMIVLAFFVFYGVPYGLKNIFDVKCVFTSLQAGTICLALNCGAYMSEIIRAGIQSIDPGQMEAARSLGMSHGMAMRLIIIPQAIRIILPAFANEFVTLIKETSVLGYVGVVEILRRGQLWNSSSFETFPAYIGVALAYLILTIPLSKAINGYERKVARRESAA